MRSVVASNDMNSRNQCKETGISARHKGPLLEANCTQDSVLVHRIRAAGGEISAMPCTGAVPCSGS